MRIKRSLQEAQNTPRIAKPAAQGEAPNKTKTQRTGTKPGTHHSGHHGQPVVATTARGGPCFPRLLVFLRVPLRLSAVFALFCL